MRIFKHVAQRVIIFTATLGLTISFPGLQTVPVAAHHPTIEEIPGWVHFVLDMRWGNVIFESDPGREPTYYSGSVTLTGEEGAAVPMHPYNWEWDEDFIDFMPTPTTPPPDGEPVPPPAPNPRHFTFKSVVYESWDGLRVRVAGPKDATIQIVLNDALIVEEDLATLGTRHGKVLYDLGNDQELVLRTLPMRDPVAMVNIWWGRIADRHVAFNQTLREGAPLSLRPKSSPGRIYATMTSLDEGTMMPPEGMMSPEEMMRMMQEQGFQLPEGYYIPENYQVPQEFQLSEGFIPPEGFERPRYEEEYHYERPELREDFLFPEFIFQDSVDFSGSFTALEGTLGRAKPRSFEDEDGILEKTGSRVAWESHIGGRPIGEQLCPLSLSRPFPAFPYAPNPVLYPEHEQEFMPPCQVYHMDRDGMMVALKLSLLTGDSPLTLSFDSPDVSYSKTLTLEELFMRPLHEPILVNGEMSGYGVMMAIHEVPDRKLLRAHGRPEVFMIEDGVRKHIPDPTVFEKQGLEWDEVEDVNEEEIDALPEDDEPLSLPDGELTQVEGDPRVYLIDDGMRRHIPNPEAFANLGLKWENILQIPPETLGIHPEGLQVDPFQPGGSPPPDGLLYRVQGDPQVYRLEDGVRFHVPNPEVFQMHRLDWEKVAELAPNHPFAGLLQGGELPPPDGALFRSENAPTVYRYQDGVAQPIDDAEDFTEEGFEWENVEVLPPDFVGTLPEGGAFISGVPDVTLQTPFTAPTNVPQMSNPFPFTAQ